MSRLRVSGKGRVSACVYACGSVHVLHDVQRDGGGQALAGVFEQVVGGQQVGAAGDKVLLELE